MLIQTAHQVQDPKHISYKKIVFVLLLAVVVAYLFFYKLSIEPFHNDEAVYAEVVRESFITAHFHFLLFFNSVPYLNKPPLLFWLIYSFWELLGNMQIAERLPSVFGSVGVIAVTAAIVLEATESMYIALFGGLALATTASFVILTRAGRFDSLATFFIALSTYAFIRARKERKWYLLFGASLGLIVLTKGPLVLFAFTAAGIYLLCVRDFSCFRNTYFWAGNILGLGIALPWHIYETYVYGFHFWQQYLLQQIVVRVEQNIVSITQPLTNWNYVTYFFIYLAPWSEIFVVSIAVFVFLRKTFDKKLQYLGITCLSVITVVFGVCFVMQSKAFRYLIPLYPYLIIFICIVLFQVLKVYGKRFRSLIQKSIIGVSGLLVFFGFLWSSYNGFLMNPDYQYTTDTPALAQNEYIIGRLLLAHNVKRFYVYETPDMRGILYYSEYARAYTFPEKGFFPGLYIVLSTKFISSFYDMYPSLRFTILYRGPVVTLVKELGR